MGRRARRVGVRPRLTPTLARTAGFCGLACWQVTTPRRLATNKGGGGSDRSDAPGKLVPVASPSAHSPGREACGPLGDPDERTADEGE